MRYLTYTFILSTNGFRIIMYEQTKHTVES